MEIKYLFFVMLINSVVTTRRLKIILDRVDTMELPKQTPVQGLDFHIAPSNNSLIQGEFTLLRDLVDNKLKISVLVIRCLVREAPDTCEYLINLKPPSACMLFNAENMAWNDFTDAFTPKMRCPIKKGKYVTNNATFDVNKWNIFPIEHFFFKLVYKLYEKDVLILEAIAEAHAVLVH